jgi:hypothetical protein
MSEHLSWSVVVTYTVYSIFAAQQKFCYRDFKGASLGYHVLLGYFGFFTSLFGVGFLIYYGFRTTWWAPLVLFSLGLLVYIPFSRLELVAERFMPLQTWGLLSFVVVPICAGLLIFFTPSHSPTRFGRPVEEALEPPWSKDFKRWDSAAKAGGSVADLLGRFGAKDLTTREDLAEQRTQAEHLSKVAFENASGISRAYLAASHPELPDAYFELFVPAMDAWRAGFAERNPVVVQQGVSHYNAFLVWMQSRDRSDFKPMR